MKQIWVVSQQGFSVRFQQGVIVYYSLVSVGHVGWGIIIMIYSQSPKRGRVQRVLVCQFKRSEKGADKYLMSGFCLPNSGAVLLLSKIITGVQFR